MRRAILKLIERAGYVVLKADDWRDFQRQLTSAQAAQLTSASSTDRMADPAPVAEQHVQLEKQLAECRSQLAACENQLTELRNQLSDCATERHLLNVRMGRADASVDAFKRRGDRLERELAASQEQLGRADPSGRIDELEAGNRRLQQRIADLEAYLKETRGPGASYL